MRRRRNRYADAGVLVAVLATVLVGCAGQTPAPYSDFERAQDDRDVLPDLGHIGDGYDPDSIRFVGTTDGLDVYLASPVGGEGRCVIVDSDEPMSGCGDEISSQSWTVRIHSDGTGPTSTPGLDWTELGENVSIRTR